MNQVDQAVRLVERMCEHQDVLALVVPAFEGWHDRLAESGPRGWRAYRHDLGDYMHRVILQAPGATLRLHKILRSDEGDLHDHPWDFTSLILRGYYEEEGLAPPGSSLRVIPTGVFGPGDYNSKRATDVHRLTIHEGPVWTFVETGPRVRDWGFATAQGWVHWKAYTGARDESDRGFR